MSGLPSALRPGGQSNSGALHRSGTTVSAVSAVSDLSERRSSTAFSIRDLPNDPPSRYGTLRRDVSPPESLVSSPVVPAAWTPTRTESYVAPSLPPLPSVPETQTYEAVPSSPFDHQGQPHRAPAPSPSGLARTLSQLRPGKLVRQHKYGPLADVEEEAAGEAITFDVTGFDGPPMGPQIELQPYSHSKPGAAEAVAGAMSGVDNIYGSGMGAVYTAHVASHTRGQSYGNDEIRDALAREAQKTGEILAVEGIASDVVDISGLDGAEYARRNSLRSVDTTNFGEKKTSYFFPDDPEKPSWKPVSMRWPYITLLIVIALLLAGVQELLCQVSMHRAKQNPPQALIVFTDANSIPTLTYFAWKYFPTMILVTYGVMVQVVDFEVKRLEPYYQLSKRRGATAADSLNLDYLTMVTYLIPIMAIKRKQWAVLCTSLATLIAGSLLAVLQSASIYQLTLPPNAPPGVPTKKLVLMSPLWSRLLTASLGLVAVICLLLMVFLRRKSGLLSDPKGIAGVASMATKSHILAEFKNLDTKSNEEVHRQLRKRRYNLHKSSLWQGEYITTVTRQGVDKPENPVPFMLRLLVGIPFIGCIVLFGLLLPVVLFVQSINDMVMRASFLLTAAATGIKVMWNTLDISVRVVEPYYILSRRHAPPKTLTLDYTGTVPGHLSTVAGHNGHWLVAAVGLGSIASEALTVMVTSFKVDGHRFILSGLSSDHGDSDSTDASETSRSFWVSLMLSGAILVYLFVVAVVVYWRRHHKFLPRQPGSIASTLAYIHQSRMLSDFVDTERYNSRQMTKHLERIGKTYGLGWFIGRDGKSMHCGVDEEPIKHSYRWGVDVKNQNIVGENDVSAWEHF
jgi:hypothetical protein